MARRLTQEAALDAIDADLGWRRLELAALRIALRRASGPSEATACRSAIALAYAHWEGYVVSAGRLLFTYVRDRRLAYRELSDPYVALCLAAKLGAAHASTRRIQHHIDVVTALRRSDDTAVFPQPESAIHGEGNLKSEKFDDIVTRLMIDKAPFELHYNWIDGELLRRRNRIAHGEYGFDEPAFAATAIETVVRLLDAFRTAAQNAVVLEVFRA